MAPSESATNGPAVPNNPGVTARICLPFFGHELVEDLSSRSCPPVCIAKIFIFARLQVPQPGSILQRHVLRASAVAQHLLRDPVYRIGIEIDGRLCQAQAAGEREQ